MSASEHSRRHSDSVARRDAPAIPPSYCNAVRPIPGLADDNTSGLAGTEQVMSRRQVCWGNKGRATYASGLPLGRENFVTALAVELALKALLQQAIGDCPSDHEQKASTLWSLPMLMSSWSNHSARRAKDRYGHRSMSIAATSSRGDTSTRVVNLVGAQARVDRRRNGAVWQGRCCRYC